MQTLHENPDRMKAVNSEVESLGAMVVVQYALLRACDFIAVQEAPDMENMARVSVELEMRGTADGETLAAIPVNDFISALKKCHFIRE